MITLKTLVKDRGYNLRSFCKAANIPETSFKNWVDGKTKPKHEYIIAMSITLAVSPETVCHALNIRDDTLRIQTLK